ncbi:hypothetical protein NKR23_g5902 [Pleurostoma richardsiae]|uniref:Zn(2)-C6 fungal-type domain-containing protein n=1 Tax=Pleurostoma richardsiae TaxID=41990 RepID=A0AA38VEL3_9PEZI|nr:hypothetical protein NKR23_g5902 [Pleurostoma richardsiae]
MEVGPSRKRLRRSTRSCYQCRKRKVKCQLTHEDVETCAECAKSGTQCTLQPPEKELSSRGSPTHGDKEENENCPGRLKAHLDRSMQLALLFGMILYFTLPPTERFLLSTIMALSRIKSRQLGQTPSSHLSPFCRLYRMQLP